ncbi:MULTISPECIES: hypothetical protein [Streptomyces]|uniref:hypothetical protein n=1 Tax=Streptomyces TaxID=1883 RepID=UPI000BF0A34B|nr:hypothetical protein [Streptomyces sp. wa1063]
MADDMKVSVGDMLLTLTGNVSDARKRLSDLENQKLRELLEGLAHKVGEHKEQLAAITEAFAALQAEPEPEPEPDWPGVSPNWTDDIDQDQARELWDWLTKWCHNILWPIYAQDVWKPCWYRHTRVRIVLTALRGAHQWSYETTKVPPTRAMEWEFRWLREAKQLLKEELKDCGLPRDDLKKPKHPVPVPVQSTPENPNPAPPAFTIEDFTDPGFFEYMERNIAKRREPDKETD